MFVARSTLPLSSSGASLVTVTIFTSLSVRPASLRTNGSIALVHVSPKPEIVLPLSVLSETVVPGFEKRPQLFDIV